MRGHSNQGFRFLLSSKRTHRKVIVQKPVQTCIYIRERLTSVSNPAAETFLAYSRDFLVDSVYPRVREAVLANDNKPYHVQRNISQTRNRCAPSLCSSRRPWAELSSKCTRDVLASGIESRSSNYPEKLRRFCIRMREYLDRWKETESKEEERRREREKGENGDEYERDGTRKKR